MRRLILVVLFTLCAVAIWARGHFRSDGGIAIGDGKLEKPYTDDLGFSLNINGHVNYINGAFIGSLGFGGLFLNDSRKTPPYYYNTKRESQTELFAELPVGIGALIDIGNAALIIGMEGCLLFSLGGDGTSYELSPHIDLLWVNKHGGNNGVFLKGIYNIGGDQKYEPRFFGIGYKVMYPPSAKKASKGKAALQAGQ